MVARLDAGNLMRRFALLALLSAAPLASATVEAGRTCMTAYQNALTKQQEAAGSGDMASYESLGKEAKAQLFQAREEFEEAGAAASDDPSVLQDYAGVLRAMGYDDLVAETMKRAIDRGVEHAALWRIHGESLLAIGPDHYQEGVEALRHALTMDNSSPEAAAAWFALGKYYLDNLMPAEAGQAFDAALALNAEFVPARLGGAAVKVYAGDVAAAGNVIEAVGRAAQPYDAMFRGMMRGALTDFDTNRRVFNDTAENHYAYARLLYLAARLPEAILAARRATDLAKDRIEIWNFLGAMQIQMRDLAGALEAYQASLAVKPDQPPIQETVNELKKALNEAAKQQPQEQAPPAQGQPPLQGKGPLR